MRGFAEIRARLDLGIRLAGDVDFSNFKFEFTDFFCFAFFQLQRLRAILFGL